jgi:hypothetical protein
VGIYAATWSSVDDGPQSKIVTIVTVGPGLSGNPTPSNNPQVVDTFVFRILRP